VTFKVTSDMLNLNLSVCPILTSVLLHLTYFNGLM